MIKPIRAGSEPRCTTELKIARFVSPLFDFVAIKFPGLNPVILLINDNLGIISKLMMSFFVKCTI
jgi:hypothetical protein